MMVEKVKNNDGGNQLQQNDGRNYVQQNDGGKLGSTNWWWKIRFNKMMVENQVTTK